MKIVFCIHGCSTKPIGGHKVLYEMANRLSERGHEIVIVFPSYDNLYQLPLPSRFRVKILKVITDYFHIMPRWFKLNKAVTRHTVYDYSEKGFPDADIVIATAAETAVPVAELPARCGKKLYFIQGYESWMMSEKELNKTYQLGMVNIVISKWLKEKIENISKTEAYYIPNAIDIRRFKVNNPIEKRKPAMIGLLWHQGKYKGLKYAFKALELVHARHSDLKVLMFGATHSPKNLPDWYEFHFRASEKEVIDIYNQCAIFVCASIDEGFGLTGAESMACGCALASTDYKGVKEYAENGFNALLSPVKDYHAMADNICRLIEDKSLRNRISHNGVKSIRSASWDIAVSRMEKILKQVNDMEQN